MSLKRIAIDMDEVMADTLGEHLARYNRDHGEQICKDDLTGKWIWDVVGVERHNYLQEVLFSENFFADLPIMEDAQRVIQALQTRYEVFIASAAMEVPTSFAAKFRWLESHFPFLPPSHIVFCGDKGIIDADYLIDDNPRQFRRFKGEGILFTSPHNKLITGYRRVNNWREVEELFLGAEAGQEKLIP